MGSSLEPGGLTQLSGSGSGNATHLGNFSGPITRIQDHHGNFATTAVFVSSNGTDSVFLAVSGHFEDSGGGSCVVTSTGTYTVTGGTGKFANATGGGTVISEIDLCEGTATGLYEGTISRPNSANVIASLGRSQAPPKGHFHVVCLQIAFGACASPILRCVGPAAPFCPPL